MRTWIDEPQTSSTGEGCARFASDRNTGTVDPLRILRPASEDEVIAEFLKAEIDSERFAPLVFEALAAEAAARSVIDEIDLDDRAANDVRRRVLARARHWKSGGNLFIGFPQDILVGEQDGSKLVLLEGHLRFTAFFLADQIPQRLEACFGTSTRLGKWTLY